MARWLIGLILGVVGLAASGQHLMTPSQVDMRAGYCVGMLQTINAPEPLAKVQGYLLARYDQSDPEAIMIALQQGRRDVTNARQESLACAAACPASDRACALQCSTGHPIVAKVGSCMKLDFLPY